MEFTVCSLDCGTGRGSCFFRQFQVVAVAVFCLLVVFVSGDSVAADSIEPAPVEAEAAQVKAEETQPKAEEIPVKAEEIPAKVEESPVKVEETPAKVEETQVKAEGTQVRDEDTQLARRFAIRESVESPFEYALSAGYRRDDLTWSIADGGVNIASEVEWKKTVIAQLRAAAKLNLGSDWMVRGIYSTGAVKSGSNRDSDYAASDRNQEYSRSDSKTGGAVRDASVGLGRKLRLFEFEAGGGLTAIPLAGLSIHQQSLTMYEGQQTIPANGELTGLNNSYATQWKGYWGGLDILLGLGERFSLSSTMEYHWVDYTAEADWNLRNDLAHPVSFRHVAKGRGVLASVSAAYRFTRNFLLNVSLERQKWNTWSGYDQTNFSYGGTGYFTLNPVSWESTSYSVGAVYQF